MEVKLQCEMSVAKYISSTHSASKPQFCWVANSPLQKGSADQSCTTFCRTGSVTTGACGPMDHSTITKETSPRLLCQPLKEPCGTAVTHTFSPLGPNYPSNMET
ncbi:hypothetical protein GOODEAATRI_030366 [Goodea atripinnis]|uniref:Uncharacterized protein n=1 Tax=Goodea atripinnis TaxID=208336 RepID=A0ABV0PSW2_9TELE